MICEECGEPELTNVYCKTCSEGMLTTLQNNLAKAQKLLLGKIDTATIEELEKIVADSHKIGPPLIKH